MTVRVCVYGREKERSGAEASVMTAAESAAAVAAAAVAGAGRASRCMSERDGSFV